MRSCNNRYCEMVFVVVLLFPSPSRGMDKAGDVIGRTAWEVVRNVNWSIFPFFSDEEEAFSHAPFHHPSSACQPMGAMRHKSKNIHPLAHPGFKPKSVKNNGADG